MLSPQIVELEQKLKDFSLEDKKWLLGQLTEQLGLDEQITNEISPTNDDPFKDMRGKIQYFEDLTTPTLEEWKEV